MTTGTAAPARPAGAVRRAIASHPLAAMLLMMFPIAWALMVPAALLGLPMEPFLIGVVLLAQLLPAVLVTRVLGGRAAVRDLFSRAFRWRVGLRWYLVAFLALPAASLLGAAAVLGPGAVGEAVTDPRYVLAFLFTLAALPLVNMWEETAWMGFVQARLADRHGLVRAAAITGPLFGLVHMPLHIGKPAGQFVTDLLLLMAFAVVVRIVFGWLYARTGASVLLVAALHATLNASNNNMGIIADSAGATGSAQGTLVAQMTWIVVGAWGLVVVAGIVIRRRRAARPESAPARLAPAELTPVQG